MGTAIVRALVLVVFFTILWAVTPVFVSFGTVWMPNLASIVFFNGETGSTEGDLPYTLYRMLRLRLIITWIIAVGLHIVYCWPADEEEANPLVYGLNGGYAGLFAFGAVCLADYFNYMHLIGVWMWWLGPIGYLMGFGLAVWINNLR